MCNSFILQFDIVITFDTVYAINWIYLFIKKNNEINAFMNLFIFNFHLRNFEGNIKRKL